MPVETPQSPAVQEQDYTSADIEVHEGIEHVRLRPAMYIGDAYERGLHHLVNEVVDNSVDEAMAGHCKRIDVTIHEEGSISIVDDGRGIPVENHPKANKPTVEVCLTQLGAGGKFKKGAYQVSGGLHGVGVSCVNALSEWLEVEVCRGGQSYRMGFARGRTTKPLEMAGPAQRRGTRVTFKPDTEIFKQTIEFKFQTIAKRLRELAYLNAGLHIVLRDERGEGRAEEYRYPEGIVDFVKELAGTEETLLVRPIYFKGRLESPDSGGMVEVEVAIQYNDTYTDNLLSYANNINTLEGGSHMTGFRTALTTTMNNWIKENPEVIKGGGKSKKDQEERPTGDDYREGLVAVVSVKIPEPQFEGQTKTKLGNSDVAGIVQSVVGNYLKAWVEQNPAEGKKIVAKAMLARDARLKAKLAKELVRKSRDALRGGAIAKLKACTSDVADECELYLVEGDSAGGTAGEARDPKTQAILPLRGKILNVWKATHDKMLSHNEIANIIQALGTGILDEFDLAKRLYGKVIIMCDADVDGSHIRTLILTFFFRQMPELIKAGMVYVAQPPLYKVSRGKDEKDAEYFLNDQEFQKRILGFGLDGTDFIDARNGGERVHDSEKLRELVTLVQEFERLARDLEKKDIPIDKYLGRRRPEDGLLPYAKILLKGAGKAPAIYTEDELERFLASARERNPELKVWFHTDPLSQREGAHVEVTRFTTRNRIQELLNELGQRGFAWEDFFPPKASDDESDEQLERAVRFKLRRKQHTVTFDALRDVMLKVQELAEKGGLQIQRYKGLGEMDDSELRETTMDPEKRQLLKVTIEDMTEANRIFSTLMGSKVEPRRAYIEENAAEVTNLDV